MQIEATGKSVELAIQNGLLECGMKREDVEIKVIETGSILKKAKVVLTWGEKKEEPVVEEPAEEVAEPEVKEETTEEVEEEKPHVEEKKRRIVDTTALEAKTTEFLTNLVKMVDENATVSCVAGENELSFSVAGENLGRLIGYHGENMQALQILLSGLKGKGEGAVRMYLDINGYKQNKNQSIIDLANKIADQAVKIERNIHLDPMNAYDRRIVHTTLQERADVTTESTGEGEKRHVVVKPVFKK